MGAQVEYFEDVEVGDEIEELEICPTTADVVRYVQVARMESGRFKVFKHLNDWFEEFRLYHRKDGRVHKEGDDLMSATRYAIMMLRYAQTNMPPKLRSSRGAGAGSWMAA